MAPEDEIEEFGFDEDPDLAADDVVRLEQADGTVVDWVLRAVVEHGEATYAVLAPRDQLDDDEGDLLVTAYREDEEGTAFFEPLADDAVLAGLEDVLGTLMGFERSPRPPLAGPVAEA